MSDTQTTFAHDASAGHAEVNYMHYFRTWLYLLGLTMLEVGIVLMGVPQMVLVAGLLIFTLMKATLIFSDFMHLRFERFGLIIIAAAPILFGFFLFIGMLLDF